MISTIRKNAISVITIVLVCAVLAVLAFFAGQSKGTVVYHNVAKITKKTTTCEKAVANYTYAVGILQPENEYLTATTNTCRSAAPWVIVIHGGSWLSGTPSTIQSGVDAFYDYGWQVFNIEYRRGANITWDMQKNDIQAAYNWVTARYGFFGLNLSKGTAYGFSAGGQMAAWLGNLKNLSSVLSISGVLQPQRVADDDNGLRPTTEPTTPEMHALHVREQAMMGCDYNSSMTPTCTASWDAFDPETAIASSSAPVYMLQGDDDPVVPIPTPDAYAYWLYSSGVDSHVVHVAGYGHDQRMLFDTSAGSISRWYNVRAWIASKW